MKQKFVYCIMALAVLVMLGCQSKKEVEKETAAEEVKEPDNIAVQHVLIGFSGSLPGKAVSRNQEEARLLAEDLFKRAQAGEDFDAMVKEYTDDSYPGIYKMANFGVTADVAKGIYARNQMVAAFGDVGFPLKVGEIGLASYDPQKSKFGWHIIKRVE